MTFTKKANNKYDYDPPVGTDIKSCIEECIKKASKENADVVIRNFNKVDLTVRPNSTVTEAYVEYRRLAGVPAPNYEIESAKILENIPSVFHDALQTLSYRASNGSGEEDALNHLRELVDHLEEPIYLYHLAHKRVAKEKKPKRIRKEDLK
jgi:hypothetical protein